MEVFLDILILFAALKLFINLFILLFLIPRERRNKLSLAASRRTRHMFMEEICIKRGRLIGQLVGLALSLMIFVPLVLSI